MILVCAAALVVALAVALEALAWTAGEKKSNKKNHHDKRNQKTPRRRLNTIMVE
jgi:hypothetical protein